MWQTLSPVAQQVARQTGRKKKDAAGASPAAAALEKMGRSIELIARLIRMDAETSGQPIVTRHDREMATEILIGLISVPAERKAYLALLDTVEATPRPMKPIDPLTRQAIHNQNWAQLSSGFLAALLLNGEAIDAVAADLLATRPTNWQETLPKPRAKTKASPPSARRPDRKR